MSDQLKGVVFGIIVTVFGGLILLILGPALMDSRFVGSNVVWGSTSSHFFVRRNDDLDSNAINLYYFENTGRKHSGKIRIYYAGDVGYVDFGSDVVFLNHPEDENPYIEIEQLASGEKTELVFSGPTPAYIRRVIIGEKTVEESLMTVAERSFGYLSIPIFLVPFLLPIIVAGLIAIGRSLLATDEDETDGNGRLT